MSALWETAYLVASSFLMIAYLIILFHIVIDLFRDPLLGGGYKALWLIGLLFLPFLTVFLYVLIRGKGQDRQSYRIKLDDLLRKGDISANVPVLPGDVILIPESIF